MSTPSTPGGPGTPSVPGSSTTDPWPTTTGGAAPSAGTDGSSDVKDQAREVAGMAAGQAKQTSGTAADQAKQTGGTAAEEGRHVASVAKGEAQNVVQESKQQAQNLLEEARTQIDEQSRTQRDRLVSTLQSFGDDIEKMANGEPTGGGMAQDLARQVSERARDLSSRIDGREPVELLDEVRSFARRRPGTFLLGALAAGVVAGRLTRGAKEAQSQNGSSSTAAGTGVYDDVRGADLGGTAAGAPTAGTGSPDAPPAYPAGSNVGEPGTTMDQSLTTTPGTLGAAPANDTTWDDPSGRGTV